MTGRRVDAGESARARRMTRWAVPPVWRAAAKPIAVAMALITLLALAGLPVYVLPSVDQVPGRADVVYVIGPLSTERLERARELVDEGIADRILLSVPPEGIEPGNNLGRYRLCNLPGGDVLCISPRPFTTQGESSAFAELASEEGWATAVLITRTPHITRSRVLMERCFDGRLAVIDAREDLDLGDWIYQYAYQTGAFIKVALNPDC